MPKGYTEQDMYPPIQRFFTRLGYQVNAEVKGCDVTAKNDAELIIVEMKTGFTTKLLMQALDRQSAAELVYMAIPRPRRVNDREFRHAVYIAKKLGLGLMTVAMDSASRVVDIHAFPEESDKAPKSRLKEALLREIGGRRVESNRGGSPRTRGVKLNTAFRERNVRAAWLLARHGPLTAAQLKNDYGLPGMGGLLRSSVYGWFEKVGPGLFDLTDQGRAYLRENENDQVVRYYRDVME